MTFPDELRRKLATAHTEALAVGDSPNRADALASRVALLAREVEGADVDPDSRSRILAALADASRVLRRDDDGREAARHLQAALRLAGDRSRQPPPF